MKIETEKNKRFRAFSKLNGDKMTDFGRFQNPLGANDG